MAIWKKFFLDAPRLLQASALAGLVFGLDLLDKFGNAVSVLYVAPVLLVGLGTARRNPRIVVIASVCTALTVAGFALASAPSVLGVAVVNRVLSLLAVWLAASLCLLCLRIEDPLDSVREFLPICTSCKKIRDEGGLWHHLETYFSEQFAVRFTHGICPDCVRQLYPEVVKKHLHHSSNITRRPSTRKQAPSSIAG
ncbi:MAG TPA: hypothetical protein VES96_00780 [Nitrospiraceae bacterium]|nr:hypothetical protein [Nitrospiraceae bacterium]